MEGMYESARQYAQILKDCSLPQVADWKLGDINSIVQWAEYFKNVQTRIAKRSSVIKKLDKKLREIGRDLGVRFGEEELSYDFLSHSSEYLTKCLLDNPVLPEELKEKVSDRNTHFAQQHLSEVEDAKLLFSSLSAIHEKLVPHQGSHGNQDLLLDLKSLDAEYLRKDLSWALAGGDSGKGWPSVKERLDSLAMEVILLSLLGDDHSLQWQTAGGPSPADHLDAARRAVFDWLLQIARSREDTKGREEGTTEGGVLGDQVRHQQSILDKLWHRRHCKLLAQVSLRYFDFFKEHFKFLVARTKKMEKERDDVSVDMELEAWTGRDDDGGGRDDQNGGGRDDGGRDGGNGGRDDQRNDGGRDNGGRNDQTDGGERDDGGRDGGGRQPLDEQVAWATEHWVELVLTGGQVKEVCLSLLLKESQQLSQISQEELAGCTLTLLPPPDSVWNVMLKAVHERC